MENRDYKKGNNRILPGLFLLAIACVLFLRQGGFDMPGWLFDWPVILIIIGSYLGLRHGFRGPAWILLIFIGSIFLLDRVYPEYSVRKYLAPIVIAVIGLVMILRPRGRRHRDRYTSGGDLQNRWQPQYPPQNQEGAVNDASAAKNYAREDYIDSTAVFGSVRKVVVSKDFKGGEMVSIFGGNELDLRQADIHGTVTLDVTQIMGGTKLILPSHWEVKSEMVAFFGGIEDKRHLPPGANVPGKLLILEGTSIFGGIEIRNY
jgi:predicted membrane protein